jgi:mannose-6-phosphate isomerase-like protein (cupin superfamily)
MSGRIPILVTVADCAEIPLGENGSEGTVRRLIAHSEGSSVLLGTFKLDVGQRGEFNLPSASGMEEEIYYMLAGVLRITWDGGEALATQGQAVFFPSGRRYAIETVGSTVVELIWTGYPPPGAAERSRNHASTASDVIIKAD